MKTVLVVDDDPIIRRLVHAALTARGQWTILEAEDGVDGVARFILHRPDTLITDISMPNSDGFEMLNVLRRGNYLTGIRVILMSGVLDVDLQQVDKSGADTLLRKPFSLQELYDAVEGVKHV